MRALWLGLLCLSPSGFAVNEWARVETKWKRAIKKKQNPNSFDVNFKIEDRDEGFRVVEGTHPKRTVLEYCLKRQSGCTTDMLSQLIPAVAGGMEGRGYTIGEYREVPLSKFEAKWDKLVKKATTVDEAGQVSMNCPLKRIPLADIDSKKFYKFVSKSEPVIFTGLTWPAIRKWTLEYIEKHYGKESINARVSDDGSFDAAENARKNWGIRTEEFEFHQGYDVSRTDVFVRPAEWNTTFSELISILRENQKRRVQGNRGEGEEELEGGDDQLNGEGGYGDDGADDPMPAPAAKAKAKVVTKVVADANGLRVTENRIILCLPRTNPAETGGDGTWLGLAWQSHSRVNTTAYCLSSSVGTQLRLRLQQPEDEVRLAVGEKFTVPPLRPYALYLAVDTDADTDAGVEKISMEGGAATAASACSTAAAAEDGTESVGGEFAGESKVLLVQGVGDFDSLPFPGGEGTATEEGGMGGSGLGEDASSSIRSSSGSSGAGGGDGNDDETLRASLILRLSAFYREHNPSHLPVTSATLAPYLAEVEAEAEAVKEEEGEEGSEGEGGGDSEGGTEVRQWAAVATKVDNHLQLLYGTSLGSVGDSAMEQERRKLQLDDSEDDSEESVGLEGRNQGESTASDSGLNKPLTYYLEYWPMFNFKRIQRMQKEFGSDRGLFPFASFLNFTKRNWNLWLGGGDTVGRLHFDRNDNLMAVLAGSKTFTLYPPNQARWLYGGTRMRVVQPVFRPNASAAGARVGAGAGAGAGSEVEVEVEVEVEGADDDLAFKSADAHGALYRTVSHERSIEMLQGQFVEDFSPVHPKGMLDGRFPGFANARGMECQINAGEVLFNPAWWWHEVSSSADDEGKNIAVNFFYEPLYEKLERIQHTRYNYTFFTHFSVNEDYYGLHSNKGPLQEATAERTKGKISSAVAETEDVLEFFSSPGERELETDTNGEQIGKKKNSKKKKKNKNKERRSGKKKKNKKKKKKKEKKAKKAKNKKTKTKATAKQG